MRTDDGPVAHRWLPAEAADASSLIKPSLPAQKAFRLAKILILPINNFLFIGQGVRPREVAAFRLLLLGTSS